MTRSQCSLPNRQRGATLAVALMFLVVLTLLSVSSVRTATMQERMAGNSRDRNLAFQAAESALRAAEVYLRDQVVDTANFNDDPEAGTAGANAGLFQKLEPDSTYTTREPGKAAYWRSIFNWTVHSRQYDSNISNTLERPRYAIEWLGNIPTACVSGNSNCTGGNDVFRITARGVGLSGNSVVYLQSTYVKL
jgi:type IV pilus assembly protein PilX